MPYPIGKAIGKMRIFTFLSLLAALSSRTSAKPTLQFTDNGTFQISVFEDLHFGEAENTDWGPLQDVDTRLVMETVLNHEHPQLIVLNGDLITGENTFKENSSDYVDQIVKPILDANLPWASTYGNHDSDFNLSRRDIYAKEKRYANSLTERMVSGDDAGITNYYLPVFKTEDNGAASETPAMLLWFFDSRGGNYYQQAAPDGSSIGQPNWVSQGVVDWFTTTRANLTAQYNATLPSLAFVHIPVDAFLAFQNSGVDANQEPGINEDVPLSQQGVASDQGSSGTTLTYNGQDVPFMRALLDTEGLIAVFSGHDHGNDWCFKWDTKLSNMTLTGNGVNMCFSRHTGYGGYGKWTRGSRQIMVVMDELGNETETWTRFEDASVAGSVSLNKTFGRDNYPAVALSYTDADNEGHPYSK